MPNRRDLLLAGLAGLVPTFPGCVHNTASMDKARHRVLVSTDIGGTDPDDFQSMAHLLVCADSFDLEGLVSSPFGPGRRAEILTVIDQYERDFPNLRTWSRHYPAPDMLREMTMQGETDLAPYAGVRRATQGSNWIVHCARRDDLRPLHLLAWGGIEDLAQALHDAPDILPKLRVYWVGGPNKKWSRDAYQYIAENHQELWIIESNATYRGWFNGGDQSGEWGNTAFVTQHVAGKGALGEFFSTQLGGTIKMGDTPSVGWILSGATADPTHPGWGGTYVRAWTRPHVIFERVTTAEDQMEIFGILDLVLPLNKTALASPTATMEIGNQSLPGHLDAEYRMRFRFSPKSAGAFTYTIKSNAAEINGLTGAITAALPSADQALSPSPDLPHWWTDDPDPSKAEGAHHGARTVNRWRQDYLRDFAQRMQRCVMPSPT